MATLITTTRGPIRPPEPIVAEARRFLDAAVGVDNHGVLSLGNDEDPKLFKLALVEAGKDCGLYVKTRKVKGRDSLISFKVVTEEEWRVSAEKDKARGKRISEGRRAAKEQRLAAASQG